MSTGTAAIRLFPVDSIGNLKGFVTPDDLPVGLKALIKLPGAIF